MNLQHNSLRIVSRRSNLAQIQVQEVMKLLPEVPYETTWLGSFGDIHHEISLLENPPADIFTREIDQALLSGIADVAIHSAKDLPYPLPTGLELIALLPATDKRDALVSRDNLTLRQLPEGAVVGTCSVVRRNELLSFRSDLKVVSIRGTIEQRIAQVDEGKVDALIVAYCALLRLGLGQRAAEVLPFKTHPLQGHLAVVACKACKALKELFAVLDDRQHYGLVQLVGFGPGDPDLLTVGGLKALKQAEVICYDDLTNEAFLHQFHAEKKYVGKRRNAHSMEQDQINRLMLDLAKAGKKVVRLKGGDPMMFAHGGEELRFLQENYVQVSVIPGISAGIAAASLTKTALTHRSLASSVSFVTGHSPHMSLPDTDTVVVYMGASHIRAIATKALTEGRNPETPVLMVHRVSLPGQQEYFSNLKTLSEKDAEYPTPLIIIIGNVANLNKSELMESPRILLTGTSAEEFACEGKVIHQPLINIEKIWPNKYAKDIIDDLSAYDWLFFTSRYSVGYFFEWLFELGRDSRYLSSLKIAAIGQVTATALAENGIRADLIPNEESSVGLLREISVRKISPARVLLTRSEAGLPVLPEGLQQAGWEVTVLPLYQNKMPAGLKPLDLQQFNKIVFSSPSCVSNFKELYGHFPDHVEFIFRGRETEKRFNNLSLSPLPEAMGRVEVNSNLQKK